MNQLQLLFLFGIFVQTYSFIFPSEDVEEKGLPIFDEREHGNSPQNGWFWSSKTKNDTKQEAYKSGWFWFLETKETEHQNSTKDDQENSQGWFQWFSSSNKETQNEKVVQKKDRELPALSQDWIEKYMAMVEELDKMSSALEKSRMSKELFVKYNSSLFHLTEIKRQLEPRFGLNLMQRYNDTLAALYQGQKVLLSYDWFDKYSEALDNLNEVKNVIDNSFMHEMNKISSTLTDLRKSWEKFSFYNIWQEQFKILADFNLPWNTSLLDLDLLEYDLTDGTILSDLKSSLPKLSSYQDMIKEYLPTLKTSESVCTTKVLTCPDNIQQFTAEACCSPLWLSIGAPLGLGNECWIDLNEMAEQCNTFSCYGLDDGKFNTTDGCTYIPDVLLNYESCVIHDLCYVTPGVTKTECDEVMKENINKIYCENVNIFEQRLCSLRASFAAKALEWTDRYFLAAGLERETCQRTDSLLTRMWKYSLNRMFRPLFRPRFRR